MSKLTYRTLFVVFAIIGVLLTLHINDALCADQKILKCEIKNGTPGAFEVPGQGFGMVMYHDETRDSQTITVLELVKKPAVDEQGKEVDFEMYRFDAMYDKVKIFCGGCGIGHTVDQFPIPPTAHNQFLVEKSLVKCK
jgi:hypothetical protein